MQYMVCYTGYAIQVSIQHLHQTFKTYIISTKYMIKTIYIPVYFIIDTKKYVRMS